MSFSSGLLMEMLIRVRRRRRPLQSFPMKNRSYIDIFVILVLAVFLYWISSFMDLFELMVDFVHAHEQQELDEVFVVAIYFVIAFGVFAWRRTLEKWRAERSLRLRMAQLDRALNEVHQLKGIIPICATCKKIRDDEGYWHQVEMYMHQQTGVDFSHGICPDCLSDYRKAFKTTISKSVIAE